VAFCGCFGALLLPSNRHRLAFSYVGFHSRYEKLVIWGSQWAGRGVPVDRFIRAPVSSSLPAELGEAEALPELWVRFRPRGFVSILFSFVFLDGGLMGHSRDGSPAGRFARSFLACFAGLPEKPEATQLSMRQSESLQGRFVTQPNKTPTISSALGPQ